jgi:hypothetical protein
MFTPQKDVCALYFNYALKQTAITNQISRSPGKTQKEILWNEKKMANGGNCNLER